MEEDPISVSALIAATRERLLQTQHTPLSLQAFEVVWRELEQFAVAEHAIAFTRALGASFLSRRYGLTLGAEPWPADRLGQSRLRAIEVLLDCQAHHPLSIRRRAMAPPFPGPWAPRLEAFWLSEKQSGRAARTLDAHRLYLGRWAQFLDTTGIPDPAALTPAAVAEFVSQTGRRYSRNTTYGTAGCLRGFLRYCYREAYTAQNLAPFVPPVRGTKLHHVPAHFPPDGIARLLAAVDRANPKGRRDYAMLLLACRLGLRASDICQLTFDSFQWDTNRVVLTQQKTGAPLTLPLLAEVGTAVIEYLQHGRPAVDDPVVFLRHTAPVGPLTAATRHSIVSTYLTRAGVAIPPGTHHGPHALRHSLASALLRQETPLPVISAILGHQDSRPTGTYLAIDLTQLRKLALEVPPIAAGWEGEVH